MSEQNIQTKAFPSYSLVKRDGDDGQEVEGIYLLHPELTGEALLTTAQQHIDYPLTQTDAERIQAEGLAWATANGFQFPGQ